MNKMEEDSIFEGVVFIGENSGSLILLECLSILELEGIIETVPGGKFKLILR